MPFLPPNQQRQSTEGKILCSEVTELLLSPTQHKIGDFEDIYAMKHQFKVCSADHLCNALCAIKASI